MKAYFNLLMLLLPIAGLNGQIGLNKDWLIYPVALKANVEEKENSIYHQMV